MSNFSGLGFFLLILKMVIDVQQYINMVQIGLGFVCLFIWLFKVYGISSPIKKSLTKELCKRL